MDAKIWYIVLNMVKFMELYSDAYFARMGRFWAGLVAFKSSQPCVWLLFSVSFQPCKWQSKSKQIWYLWHVWKGVVTKNTHVKHQSPSTYHSKDMSNVISRPNSNVKVTRSSNMEFMDRCCHKEHWCDKEHSCEISKPRSYNSNNIAKVQSLKKEHQTYRSRSNILVSLESFQKVGLTARSRSQNQ
jgi:hypothetical protein